MGRHGAVQLKYIHAYKTSTVEGVSIFGDAGKTQPFRPTRFTSVCGCPILRFASGEVSSNKL